MQRLVSLLWWVGSLLAVVLLLEGFLYLLFRFPPPSAPFSEASRAYFSKTFRVPPQYTPDCFRYDRLFTYLLTEEECRIRSFEYSFSAKGNSLGLRDDEESLNNPQIVVLGDGHSFGWGVERERTYPVLLEALSGKKVLNIGMPGWGASRGLLFLEKLRTVQPQTIIYQHGDAASELNELAVRTDEIYRLSEQSYRRKRRQEGQVPKRPLLPWLRDYWPHLAQHYLKDAPDSNLKEERRKHNREARMLLRLLENYEELVLKPRVIIIEIAEAGHNDGFFANAFQELTKKRGRRFPPDHVKAYRISQQLSRKEYFRLDPHLNERGHEKAAEILNAILQGEESG